MVTVPATGEIVEPTEVEAALSSLMGYVQTETQRLWEEHKETLGKELALVTAKSPAEAGRQVGVNPDLTFS